MLRRPTSWPLVVGLFVGCNGAVFEVNGVVTRCDDATPIVGARVRLALVSGVSGNEEGTSYTSPLGRYTASLNEPPSATARITISKPGYSPVDDTLDGAPNGDRNYCLSAGP